jgi:hypothetical protein
MSLLSTMAIHHVAPRLMRGRWPVGRNFNRGNFRASSHTHHRSCVPSVKSTIVQHVHCNRAWGGPAGTVAQVVHSDSVPYRREGRVLAVLPSTGKRAW